MQRLLILPAILALLALPLMAQDVSDDSRPGDCPNCPCCKADPPCERGAGWRGGPGPGPGAAKGDCGGWRGAGKGRFGGRGAGFGPGGGRGACLETLRSTLDELPVGELDKGEAAAVLYNREEEKLARDVYRALADTWELPIFSRIAGSEVHHMELVGLLLERHGLEDPVVDDRAGQFTNARLAELYDELVTRGKSSRAAALEVGVTIEEMDLADLTASYEGTDEADARAVYERLIRATRHHLRAFQSHLGVDAG